jgi:signal transduction histidine kinase
MADGPWSTSVAAGGGVPWPRSLRWRFALWFGLLLVASAVTVRLVHYRATADLLARDLDVQLWARLGTLEAQERFAPDTLLDPGFHVAELFMPAVREASGWTASHAVGLVVPYAGQLGDASGFTWFAGVWRPDGTSVDGLELPEGFAWQPEWLGRLGTLWTSTDGRHRLAATAGAHDTILVAGTPLDGLQAQQRRAFIVHTWTFLAWLPIVLGTAWLLLSRVLRPLGGIAATARRIQGGAFEERLDVGSADAEIAGLAAALNAMLDRLDAVRLAQSRFNADVAHQLLNPVHGIILEADVALSRPRAADMLATSVGRMSDLARRIEGLCEALLTFSRTAAIDAGRLGLVDLEPVVAEAVEQVAAAAAARGVVIDATGSAVVRGDASLLHEALVNLLGNAVTHSRDGGRIEVVVESRVDGCRVRVVDHGAGVAPEALARLFERFHAATPGGGHGVGLALSRGILRAHGGDVSHSPTPGGGATFELRLPAAR